MDDQIKQIRDRYNEANEAWEFLGIDYEQGVQMGIEFTIYKLEELYPGLAKKVFSN